MSVGLRIARRPGSATEADACRILGLPVQPVNIRKRKLNKFEKTDAVWTYRQRNLDLWVIDFLLPRWSLDYDSRPGMPSRPKAIDPDRPVARKLKGIERRGVDCDSNSVAHDGRVGKPLNGST